MQVAVKYGVVQCGMATREVLDGSVLQLGDWLARWRRSVGVSQRVLADRAGIDQSGLSRLERGLQVVGARRLARIIDALDELGRYGVMGPIQPPPFRPGTPAPPAIGRNHWDS